MEHTSPNSPEPVRSDIKQTVYSLFPAIIVLFASLSVVKHALDYVVKVIV